MKLNGSSAISADKLRANDMNISVEVYVMEQDNILPPSKGAKRARVVHYAFSAMAGVFLYVYATPTLINTWVWGLNIFIAWALLAAGIVGAVSSSMYQYRYDYVCALATAMCVGVYAVTLWGIGIFDDNQIYFFPASLMSAYFFKEVARSHDLSRLVKARLINTDDKG